MTPNEIWLVATNALVLCGAKLLENPSLADGVWTVRFQSSSFPFPLELTFPDQHLHPGYSLGHAVEAMRQSIDAKILPLL